MIRAVRVLFFVFVLGLLPGEVHARDWNPFKFFKHHFDCANARANASRALDSHDYEQASATLENYVNGSGCKVVLQDRIDLIFSHYKAAGLDGGAMSRAFFDAINDRSHQELMAAWKTEQPTIPFSELGMKHLARAIQLHESLTEYYDHDAYFFKVMAIHTYRAVVVTLAVPPALFTDELAKLVFADLVRSAKAMEKTTKYRPEIAELLMKTSWILDRDGKGSPTKADLEAFARRYR